MKILKSELIKETKTIEFLFGSEDNLEKTRLTIIRNDCKIHTILNTVFHEERPIISFYEESKNRKISQLFELSPDVCEIIEQKPFNMLEIKLEGIQFDNYIHPISLESLFVEKSKIKKYSFPSITNFLKGKVFIHF